MTGSHRAASTGDWVTIDRFDVDNQPVAGTDYRFVNRVSGKPLAVAGGSTADGAQVVQQTGGAWTVKAAPGGSYTLSYTGSGKLLDVNGHSSADCTAASIWACAVV
ncbi:RICIN domain-containing protein [Kitasatospora sp. McL0602]|uniref:RICIN domain-containing protein n=1 Tax=Kitasatospora sp. McL0602 TaxID=3439530 RepID=UPI003F8B92D4